MKAGMKVVFAGTPEFAAVALRALIDAGFAVPLVLTQPDRPAGRGMQLQASSVKGVALAHGIEVLQPLSLRMDAKDPQRALEARAAHERLLALDYDVMVVAAYGLILPRSTLDIKPCINIHGSILPRWRGAAPIHRAIESGDLETGVTIMEMEEGLDTGPMLSMARIPIEEADTTGSLHDKLATLGARMIVEVLHRMAQDGLPGLHPVPQPEQGVTYAAKISKEEAKLDLSQPADVLARKVRAFNPFPGAQAQAGASTIKIWNAQPTTGSGNPGQVLAADASGIVVACGQGALRLTELQKPGGKRLPAAEFLKGFSFDGVSLG
jgi:methionyl-tRNA formyltransferase